MQSSFSTPLFDTLVQAIQWYQQMGYDIDFNRWVNNQPVPVCPVHCTIETIHRFESDSNPEDESVLYVISDGNGLQKGLLVNGFGVYADECTSQLLHQMISEKRSQ